MTLSLCPQMDISAHISGRRTVSAIMKDNKRYLSLYKIVNLCYPNTCERYS